MPVASSARLLSLFQALKANEAGQPCQGKKGVAE